jgi:hypothetical protein
MRVSGRYGAFRVSRTLSASPVPRVASGTIDDPAGSSRSIERQPELASRLCCSRKITA